jgi:hypothetical protein
MTHAASTPPQGAGFAARERTCPSCGTTATTPFEQCPACGRRYDAPPPGAGRGRRRALAAAGAVLLVATVVFVALSLHAKARQERRDRAADAVAVARERARLIRLQAPHRGAATGLRPPAGASSAQLLQARHALVVALQDAITRDARRRAATRELEGPIVGTQCGPLLRAPDAVPDDRRLGRPVGRFDCLALRRSVVDASGREVAGFGYPFVAAVDFRRFTYTFCRNTPPQGERGKALAQVRLDRACLAARGRALGTGYVDTDGERG